MATIVPHLGDVTGAIGPFQIQGSVRRYPESRMLRRRQPGGGEPTPAQVNQRDRFTHAAACVEQWSNLIDPLVFGTFPRSRHGPNALRRFALRALIAAPWPALPGPEGVNLFPRWPHLVYLSPGGPSRIWFRSSQHWVDPALTDTSLTLVGFAWDSPPYDTPSTFAFTWPFTPPDWSHNELVDTAINYNPAMFVFSGTKQGRRISSCIDHTLLRSDG